MVVWPICAGVAVGGFVAEPLAQAILDRVVGGAVRRILDLPLIRPGAMLIRETACERYRRRLPPPPSRLRDALRELHRAGLFVASPAEAAALGCGMPDLRTLFERLENAHGVSTARLKASDFKEVTAAYLAGLHPDLLELAERHIGLPPLYLGMEVKVEFPDGLAVGVRNWHWDLEDVRVLKVLVYCSDVGEGDGPLQYIPLEESRRLRKAGITAGIHTNTEMGSGPIQECTGLAGTVIFMDGAQLLHRVKPPTQSRRRSLVYSYASKRPRQIFAGARPSKAARKQLSGMLTPLQMKYIP